METQDASGRDRELAGSAAPRADEKADWLVPGLFARGGVYVLDAGERLEISFSRRMAVFAFCMRLSLAVARGKPFLGTTTARPLPVLYADFENGAARIARQLQALGARADEAADMLIFSDRRAFPTLINSIERLKPPAVILASDVSSELRDLQAFRDLCALARKANTGLWLMRPFERSARMEEAIFYLADGWADVRDEPYGLVLETASEFGPGARVLVARRPAQASGRPEVYFIQASEDGPIKIGASADTRGRLAALQTANPTKLCVIATLPDTERARESRLHRRFAAERLRGEWFSPSERLLGWIKANALLWPTG